MKLEICNYPVEKIVLSEKSEYKNGFLSVSTKELKQMAYQDNNIKCVKFHVVSPGEKVRIMHVIDVIEPRYKIQGNTSSFPGFTGDPTITGAGITNRLCNCAITLISPITQMDGTVSVKETILDTFGIGKSCHPFGDIFNLVVEIDIKDGVDVVQACSSIRMFGLRMSEYLSKQTISSSPQSVDLFELTEAKKELPNVACILLFFKEGRLHNAFNYGLGEQPLPLLMHPNEVLDGAIVSAHYQLACLRQPTYYYQNHSLIKELYKLHGEKLNFAGVIFAQSLITSPSGKERSASQSAKICKMLGIDAVIVASDTAGHGWVDQMLTCKRCHESGIKVVNIMAEMADDSGDDLSIVMAVPEIDAVISTGNFDEIVVLEAPDRLIGKDEFLDMEGYEISTGEKPSHSVKTPTRRLYSSTSEHGFSWLTTEKY